MSDKAITRADFEAKFPKPACLVWEEKLKAYLLNALVTADTMHTLHSYSEKLRVWQAAKEQYAPKWISVEDRLPEPSKKVLLSYKNGLGNRRVVVGLFAPKFTLEAGTDDHEYSEYSEENDEYYCQEGWYEQQDNWDEYRLIFIHEGEVDLWQPIPQLGDKE